MKNTTKLLSLMLVLALTLSLVGCYFVSGQPMRTLKGTYKLATYTYTPQHERREGYTPTTYDYVNGEKYMYEDYLIITGTSTGYYVHKGLDGDAYIKEITLRYEYDEENSAKVNYVIYNDAISVNSDEGGTHRLGVSKNSFNYSKSAFDYTELITKRQMRTESISVHWEKVDNATDLSYVTKCLGNLKHYDYASFAKRGIYDISAVPSSFEAIYGEIDYLFYVIDTAGGNVTATAYYASVNSDEHLSKSVTVSLGSDGWSSLTIDGLVWTANGMSNNSYSASADGTTFTLTLVNHSISASSIEQFIDTKMPNGAE